MEPFRIYVGLCTNCNRQHLSSFQLNAYLTRLISEPNQARGLIVTSDNYNPAKTLSAAALALAASRRGLRTLLVSSEKLTPSMTPDKTNYRSTAYSKTAEELLAPFTTEQERLFFVSDDAWKRIPGLCLETLTNAHHCVDLLILDAPMVSAESDLAIMSSFAASIVLVRNTSDIDTVLTQVVFEGYGTTSYWQEFDSSYNVIRPVPEPSTYGAILMTVGLSLWFWRRRRATS